LIIPEKSGIPVSPDSQIVMIRRILPNTSLVNIDAPQIGPWNTFLRYVTMNIIQTVILNYNSLMKFTQLLLLLCDMWC
jgi:hypothetical protein